MSAMFCPKCSYKRPGCACDDPLFFYKHARETESCSKSEFWEGAPLESLKFETEDEWIESLKEEEK